MVSKFIEQIQGYKYNFKTYKQLEKDEESKRDVVTGGYSYVDSEGRTIKDKYAADAGIGFNPKSDIWHYSLEAILSF